MPCDLLASAQRGMRLPSRPRTAWFGMCQAVRTWLSIAALVTSAGVAEAQEKATVTVDRLNVRRSASIEAAIVGTLTRGTSVQIEERAEAWTRVTAGRISGWVRTSMLAFAAAAPATRAPSPTPAAPTAAPPARPAIDPPASQAAPTTSPTAPSARREAPAPATEAAPSAVTRPRAETDAGIRIGVLGSVTPIEATPTVAASNHLAALPLLMIQGSRLGVFAAPEIGTGAGYRTLMLGGGVSLRLLSIGRLHIRAAGGYTTYSETLDAVGTEASVTTTAHGASAGGIVTLRLFGRASLAYRGHLVKGFGEYETLEFQRHSVGLVF